MNSVTTRRISQVFFFLLFFWFCTVSTIGERWWQLRGWPVNWLIELDPLVGLATVLTTGTLYAGLLWGLVTVLLTLVLGRFFCGWVCPFGTLHQAVSWVALRNGKAAEQIRANRYRKAQTVKYVLLAFLLAAASGELLGAVLALSVVQPAVSAALTLAAILAFLVLWVKRTTWRRWAAAAAGIAVGWLALGFAADGSRLLAASLQTGLLDPIPLFYRSVNLTLLPLLNGRGIELNPIERLYPGAWLIGCLFWLAVLLNFAIPRFYCRFVCPLGALFGLLAKNALWRIGQATDRCTACKACDRYCQGGCEPSAVIRTPECLLCVNCLQDCQEKVMGYRLTPSLAGEVSTPDVSRRLWLAALVSGVVAIPLNRLSGIAGSNWNPSVIRPPGSLPEAAFLDRCIKCGQCMRICPTNVIQPTGLQSGIEGLWTPSLNFRMGSSGCQHGCIACGNLCPTAAIRPITVEERLGRGAFQDNGPIRIGTAFVDRGRCLPWAMARPCIVCQENCPVSPKAIVTHEIFQPVKLNGQLNLQRMDANLLTVNDPSLLPDRLATGDHYVSLADAPDGPPARITGTEPGGIRVASNPFAGTGVPGARLQLLLRLQQPFVDPTRCIGCGICEHECPVKGKRAIRVTAENESREREHNFVL